MGIGPGRVGYGFLRTGFRATAGDPGVLGTAPDVVLGSECDCVQPVSPTPAAGRRTAVAQMEGSTYQ